MHKTSGEIVIGLLVGLLIGGTMLYVKSGKVAQQRANITGLTVSQWDVIAEDPGKSTLTVIGPAAAGAGVGWLVEQALDSGSDEGGSQDSTVTINGNEGTVSVSISGNQANTSSTRTDTRTEGSNNQ